MRASAIFLCLAPWFSSCTYDVTPPERPKNVPESAIWAGGVDGGAWIDCRPAFKEPYAAYRCTTYFDSGSRWSVGTYTYAKTRGDFVEYVSNGFTPPILDECQGFDGVRIRVDPKRILIPSGWIDYPFSDDGGKRVRYVRGEEVETENY